MTSFIADQGFASWISGWNATETTSAPHVRFMFFIRFVKADGKSNSDTRIVTASLKSIDRPKFAFQTHRLNQYNKRRVVQTSMDFGEVKCVLMDRSDHRLHDFFIEYFTHYYHHASYKETKPWSNDIITPDLNVEKFGYKPMTSPANSGSTSEKSNFLDRVEIYQLHGPIYNMWYLVNPKIKDYDPDALDYTEMAAFNEITLNIEFEGAVFVKKKQRVTQDIINMGFIDLKQRSNRDLPNMAAGRPVGPGYETSTTPTGSETGGFPEGGVPGTPTSPYPTGDIGGGARGPSTPEYVDGRITPVVDSGYAYSPDRITPIRGDGASYTDGRITPVTDFGPSSLDESDGFIQQAQTLGVHVVDRTNLTQYTTQRPNRITNRTSVREAARPQLQSDPVQNSSYIYENRQEYIQTTSTPINESTNQLVTTSLNMGTFTFGKSSKDTIQTQTPSAYEFEKAMGQIDAPATIGAPLALAMVRTNNENAVVEKTSSGVRMSDSALAVINESRDVGSQIGARRTVDRELKSSFSNDALAGRMQRQTPGNRIDWTEL